MNKVGFIGYGSMGSMLVNGFISSKVLRPDDIVVSSRSLSKLEILSEKWPEISITASNRAVAQNSRLLFICVKPLDVLPVLAKIKAELTNQTHLVSIAACVTISNIESIFNEKVTRVIPSLTSEVKEGITLICHNSQVQEEDAKTVEKVFNSIGKVIRIEENDFEAGADLTSCAPGMIAAIFNNFVEAGLRHSNLTKKEAQDMAISTLFGTARLLVEKNMSFEEMVTRVATKGGITEEAVKVLNNHLPTVFDEVFQKTLNKYDIMKDMVLKQQRGEPDRENSRCI